MTNLWPIGRVSIACLFAGASMVLAMTAAPVSLGVDDSHIMVSGSNALAKGGGGGNGDKDKGDKGGGKGHAKSGKWSSGADDGPGKGKAKKVAKARYRAAVGSKYGYAKSKDEDFGTEEYTLTDPETEAMVKKGWGKRELDARFGGKHSDRVHFYKDLARALGLPNHFGTKWANFGDPIENGVADLQAALAQAETDGDTEAATELEAKLAAAIIASKPGHGPKSGWETVDIDLNDDGIVDETDLAIAQAGATTEGTDTAED